MSAIESIDPAVSVIIPVKNGFPFLDEAIASVLQQSFSDFELILIDDGSDDDDYDRFERLDPRVRVYHLPGCGVSTARNTGMQHAKGKFFAFLDADDVWFPGKLEAQIRYLQLNPHVWVVFGGFAKWMIDVSGSFPAISQMTRDCSAVCAFAPEKSGWLYTRLLTGLLVGMNTAVIRREVYTAINGFDESMLQGEDYDFWLKASRLAEMHSLACEVALYRIHESSAMHRISKNNHLAILLKAARLRWGLRNPDGSSLSEADFQMRLCQVEFDHGYTHFWRGSPNVAKRSFWVCIKGGYRFSRSAAYLMRCFISQLVR